MKKLLFLLLFIPSIVFANPYMSMIGAGIQSVSSPVLFFETDWSTNNPGSTDIKCLTCGGCSGLGATYKIWDVSASTNTTVSSGALSILSATSDSAANLFIRNSALGILTGLDINEWWAEFSFTSSMISGYKNLGYITLLTSDSSNSLITLKSDASGNLNLLNIGYVNDSGLSYICTNRAINVQVNTPIIFRYHFKAATSAGSNNGIAEAFADGATICSGNLSNVDSDTIRLSQIHLDLNQSIYNSTSFTKKYDNFKLYLTNPGW